MQERPRGAFWLRSTPRKRLGTSAALFGVLVVLNGIIMWPLLVQDEFVPGEFKEGSFDVLAGKPTLLLDDAFLNELYPLIDLFADGQLAIPPGYSAAFPLEPTLEYRIRAISSATAPYIALGDAFPLPSSVRLDRQIKDVTRPPSPAYLGDAKVLGVDTESRLELRPWDAGRPWRADAQWLTGLTSICALPDAPLELLVRVDDGKVTFRLGRCAGQTTLSGADGATPMMAVIAGPYSTVVEKAPRHWGHRSRVALSDVTRFTLVLLVVQAGIAALAVGMVRGLVATASLALASLFFSFEAAVVWLLMGVLGVVVAFVRLAYRLGLPWGAVFAGTMLAGIVLTLTIWRGGGSQSPPPRLDLGGAAFDASKGAPRCLLTGYSTTADAGLHYGTPGIFGLLDTACAACEGGTARVAWRGGAFSQIRDTICADDGPIAVGQQIVFLGGVNDDFQLPLQATTLHDRLRGYFMAARIMFSLRELPKNVQAFDAVQILMVSVEVARRNVAAQAAMIRQAVECARQRGARLWFFHDYIASDLAVSSPGRAFLLEQRRDAVESSQARFVSLLEATADRAGVSWFNDIVHLSAIGHREVEQIICGMLHAAPATPRK